MNTPHSALRAPHWGVACAALLLAAVPAPAQPRITGEGTEGFRALLVGKGLQPLQSVDELKAVNDPSRVLIVLFHGADPSGRPRPDGLDHFKDADVDLKRDFVDRGGALWVATDQTITDKLNDDFGGSVEGEVIYAPRGRFGTLGYLGNPECPYVQRKAGAIPDLFARPAGFPGDGAETPLLRVATNRPSYLGPSRDLTTLAVFTFGTWAERDNTLGARNLPFAQGRRDDASGGKFLLTADHSVFINSMLLPRAEAPNDNLPFAANCVDWLRIAPDGGQRSYVLFVEDGRVYRREDYNLILQSLPQPRPEDVAQFLWENRDLIWQNSDLAEALLAQMEQDGVFDAIERSDVIANVMNNLLGPWAVARIVLVLGAIGLFVYGLKALAGSRGRVAKTAPRLAAVLDRMRPRTGLLELRLRSGLGRGLYYELARQRAREMFADLDLTPIADGALPPVTVDAGPWRRYRVMRDLREVWAVAFGPEPVPVNARQWDSWGKKLARLRQLIRNGTVSFQ